MTLTRFPSVPAFAASLILALISVPAASAQQSAAPATSREVVQALPTPEVERLRAALQRLAGNPQDLAALVEAGEASLGVEDLDAALGFFGRALELAPSDPRAKLGMASVYLRSQRPIQALQMFSEAEQAGVSLEAFLGDWGLAQDLAGNNALAQQSYRKVLETRPDETVRRRLAISLAISGDRAGFEAALLPLLERKDLAAYRARSFGLAILGDTETAGALANQLMPADLASRMAPYLAYMPRLTKGQQAAAANLGIFPRAAEIGRDDPRLAGFATSGNRTATQAGSRLAPRGAPLGQSTPRPARDAAPAPGESRLARVSREQVAPKTSVSEAFNGLADPVAPQAAARPGAVDVTAIAIPREARPKPAEPVRVTHPSRHWVQVETGRDLEALKFDWRRLTRRVPDLLGKQKPHVASWGRATRLLAGPFRNEGDARDLASALRAEGLDSFTFTSGDGEEVTEL